MAQHILLFSIDNLRYDCIGYQPDKTELLRHDVLKLLETPTLDRIAEKSACFTKCISTNTYTTAAHSSALTGLYPPRHGVRAFYETKLSKEVYTLAEILKIFGFQTVMMTDIPHLFCPLELNRGFDHFFHSNDSGLLEFLEKNREKKLFIFVHFFDVHEPFLMCENDTYDNSDYWREVTLLYERFDLMKYQSPKDSEKGAWLRLVDRLGGKDHKTFLPLYVRGVSKFDKGRFNDFLSGLARVGLLEDSLLVIFADHGEGRSSSEDPEVFAHGGELFDSVVRVPLIISHRDFSHRMIDKVVSIVDIFPTILSLTLPKDTHDLLSYQLDGIDLQSETGSDNRAVYSETWQKDNEKHVIPLTFISSLLEQRCLRVSDKKYVINGTPELFLRKEAIDAMTDETFLHNIYRGLLCRFEEFGDYSRELSNLKTKKVTKSQILESVRQSSEYISKPSHVMYDLKEDPFELKPIVLTNNDKESMRQIQTMLNLSKDSAKTEEVFDDKDILSVIEGNLARLLTKDVSQVLMDKHLLSQCIDDYINIYQIDSYERTEIEQLITVSEEFTKFLLQQVTYFQRAESSIMAESDVAKELQMIRNSLTWKIMSKITNFMDSKLFPSGTHRQRLFVKLMNIIRRAGVEKIDRRFIERLRNETRQKKILVITYEVPRFDKYSGAHRFFNLLHILKELGFMVTVFSDSSMVQSRYVRPLQELGVYIMHGRESFHYLKELGDHFDYVILHTPSTADYIYMVRRYFQRAFIIFDTSDLHYVRVQREWEITGNVESARKAKEFKRKELSLAKKSDLVFVVSNKEKEILLHDMPYGRVEVIPNIHRIESTGTSFEKRRDIMFIGAFSHNPNSDAVLFFLKEIFPRLLEDLDINFYIIGDNPPKEGLTYQNPNVIFTGYVPDVIPYFEKCRVMVAPLRYGAGVKGKLTQSMSLGLPFVTSSIGAEGMDLIDGHHCFIVDDPKLFAEKIFCLYTEQYLWEQFRENSLRLAQEHYSYEAVKDKIRGIFSAEI
ncbi:MAG: glycosyltransferase [Dissulfurispiraceae bacterium]